MALTHPSRDPLNRLRARGREAKGAFLQITYQCGIILQYLLSTGIQYTCTRVYVHVYCNTNTGTRAPVPVPVLKYSSIVVGPYSMLLEYNTLEYCIAIHRIAIHEWVILGLHKSGSARSVG